MGHFITKRNTPFLRKIGGTKLHTSSKILNNSLSGHRNFSIFVFIHAQEPLVYKMPKGWWHILLENEIRLFLRKIVGTKLHTSSKILNNSFSGHRNFSIFVFIHAQEPLVCKMPKGWWDI